MAEKEAQINQIQLSFWGKQVCVKSDSSSFSGILRSMYRRFLLEGEPSQKNERLEIHFLTGGDNRWGKPVLVVDQDIWWLNDPRLLETGLIYEIILNAILARIRSHLLIHAGVVSWQGQGVILAADSACGKTTLTLELVRRGFRFLSDEFAAIGRADGKVYPFPRSLRVRPGSLEMAGFPRPAPDAAVWLDKLLLDIDEIQPGSLGGPAAIRHVIVLRDPSAQEDNRTEARKKEIVVLVDRLEGDLVAAIKTIPGISTVQQGFDRGYPSLSIQAESRMSALGRVEALCRERGILLLDVIKRREERPDFRASARLQAIPKSQAVMELLRRFQGGHQSALLSEEPNGGAARLFTELASLISAASCHQLSVGPLQQMAGLVCDLAGFKHTGARR